MYLGIDIGTSAVKLSLATDKGIEVRSAEAGLTLETPHPYWFEQDPVSWWAALVTAARSLDLSAVQAIGLSGQMHGAVLLDRQGDVIRPAILWNDGRSHAECARLQDRVPDIGHVAGVPPLPGFTAPKIMWLKRHEPDVHARLAHILLPKDYVGFRLHGQMVTDKSDAAGTLWLDQRARAWSAEIAAASDTPFDALPACVEGTEIAGTLLPDVAAALGLPAGIPVAAGGGDAAAGAVGIGAVVDGQAFISLGTSGQFFVATDTYRPNPGALVHAYAHAVPGMWFQMAAMLNGARPLSWFAEVCDTALPVLLTEAAQISPTEAPLFLPYLSGERSPHGDPHIRGAFYGLGDGNGRAAMMRGIVNAIAFSFADAADSLRAAGTDCTRAAAIGGGAQSDLVLQTIADVVGIEITRHTGATTGPALGAARLAACATGALDVGDLSIMAPVETTFVPRAGCELGGTLTRYRDLYRRLKDFGHG